ncbi:hypothetical protein CDEF62S_05368 [Castellaniella defragrans]
MGEKDKMGRQVGTMTLNGFRRAQPIRVVSTCPDCDLLFLMYRSRLHNFAHCNMVPVMAENLEKLQELMKYPVNRTVVLHTHDANDMRKSDNDALYRILERIPGLRILKDVGAAGLGNHCLVETGRYEPTVSVERQRKMFDELTKANADTLAVMYHGCYRQNIRYELEYPIEVKHYLALVAESVGIKYRETMKELRKLDSLDAAVEQLRPAIEKLGYREEDVRNALKAKVYV